MKKFSLSVLPLFLLSFFLSGCSWKTDILQYNDTQQTALKSNPPPAPVPKITGVRGLATTGPACPVEKNPPDPKCADKPYVGSFSIATADGKSVKTFETAADGSFDVVIPAGTYVMSLANAKTLPHMSPRTITVKDGKYTSIHLELDSGIR